MRYAANTSVPIERSQAEIQRTLQRYGADQFMLGWEQGIEAKAAVSFRLNGRVIRFVLPLPDPGDREFTHTPGRQFKRTDRDARTAWDKACRQRWRALAAVILALLEATETGILTIEDAFLSQTVLPNNRTVSEVMQPRLAAAQDSGKMPALPLLPAPDKP